VLGELRGTDLLEISEKDGIKIIQFQDSHLIDATLIKNAADELLTHVNGTAPKIILDFTNILFLASAMLGKLITVHRQVRLCGGTLAFCSIPEQTLDTFRVSKLDTYFDIYPDVEHAIGAIKDAV
jgi:anti-sigma B factor antagonist